MSLKDEVLAVNEATAGAAVVARLQRELGADIVKGPGEADFARHDHDFTNRMEEGLCLPGIAYPRTTDQVSKILAICQAEGFPVTPQGGLTGLAGGGVPAVSSLLLSMERMRAIEELDPVGRTITVQAGTVLETVQKAAEDAGFFFPLDLGGRGTAQVGGNASTNAGGNRVLRYGMMRDLVLGVEAVLADGTVISSLNTMLKNNAGYDLKHLFIGSEGTLGVITRLVLRLFPKPRTVSTALVAADDFDDVLKVLHEASEAFAGSLSAFELMWGEFYALGTTALSRQSPLPNDYGIYVLIETLGVDPERDPVRFEEVIGGMIESGILKDAVIAQSDRQRQDIWAIRDCPGEFPKMHWPQLSFDVSLPAAKIGAFVPFIGDRLRQRWPDIKMVFFGHLADSNLHLSVRLDPGMSEHELDEVVYPAVGEWGGSISAEHGIGSLKREWLHYSRTPEELALMRLLKASLDPKNILNPGKVL
jgi:FAD/FMN-containing dehydrogenase